MSPSARLRLFYFFYYGAVGANLPYFAAYLRGLGFSGKEIGTVSMMGPVVAAPVALAWATVADRFGAPSRVLAANGLWSATAVALLPFARTPWAAGAVVLAWSLAERAVVPLVDSVTLEWVRGTPGANYARIRLFGSLGFIAVVQGVGLLLSARGNRPGDRAVPFSIATCVALYALAARRLPATRPPSVRPRAREALALLRERRLVALLVACGVHWAGCAPFHLMFGMFVRDENLPASVTGLAMATGVGAEVLALFAFPYLEARFRTRALFALAFAGTALRWSLLASAHSPTSLVLLQLFHGLTFGVFWGASMRALAREVEPKLRATGQALYAAVVFGAFTVAGYQLAGLGYDRLGGVGPLFACAAALEALLLCATLWQGGRWGARRR
ncbi:MAG TPA: MFS transporter [Anaeromyxobacteraceae bacterium]|nr:MFS transporter [Anaeromyxobacteraceae bacterium]